MTVKLANSSLLIFQNFVPHQMSPLAKLCRIPAWGYGPDQDRVPKFIPTVYSELQSIAGTFPLVVWLSHWS